MRKVVLFFLLILITNIVFAQQKAYTSYDKQNKVEQITVNEKGEQTKNIITKLEEDESKYGSISENISFGLSLGFNNTLENLKLAQISPIDNTLIISDAQKTNFVLSTAISVPISFNKKRAFRYLDKNGEEIAQVHRISEWSIIGIINLVTLNGAESGEVFNQKISGGLGISYSFSSDFSIGLSYELISYRKPKDFLLALEGQEIQSNGQTLQTIEISDNDYYFDRYAGTVAFKIIYKLTKG